MEAREPDWDTYWSDFMAYYGADLETIYRVDPRKARTMVRKFARSYENGQIRILKLTELLHHLDTAQLRKLAIDLGGKETPAPTCIQTQRTHSEYQAAPPKEPTKQLVFDL